MDTAQWHREWADVGTEDEPVTEEEQSAAEEAARDAIEAEWDALHNPPQAPTVTTTADGQPF
jgi:hypothetical protein